LNRTGTYAILTMTINENAILVVVLVIAAIFDYSFKKVPNIITFPAIAAGLTMAFLERGFIGLSISTAGLVIGMALLSLPYAAGGMGAGDLKFLGAIGAIKGPWFVFITFLAAAIIGGVMAVFRIAFVLKKADMMTLGESVRTAYYTRNWSALEIPEYAKKEKLPYAVAISAGAAVSLMLDIK
jgi:prepilin peptidase CpaA